MKKILAFGASNSKQSINRQLAIFVAHNVAADVGVIDLNDFEMPIYSPEREAAGGVPEAAQKFKALIDSHDGLIISLAEYNGSYTAAFKNILDWASRLEGKLWNNKPMFLLSSSPGARGGATVIGAAATSWPYMGANIVAQFSLPSFHKNFSDKGIVDAELLEAFKVQLEKFKAGIE